MSTSRARTLRHNQTEPERAMWRILWHFREKGWHFRRQQPIGPYYADFACLHAKLVIECDGATHTGVAAVEHDAERDAYMQNRGIQILRFTNDDVMHNEDGVYSVIASVLEAVTAATNTPHPVPPPQGGRRRSNRNPGDSVGSPSPLRGGDRGGGTLPTPASPPPARRTS